MQGEEPTLVLRPRPAMNSSDFQDKWTTLAIAHTWEVPLSVCEPTNLICREIHNGLELTSMRAGAGERRMERR